MKLAGPPELACPFRLGDIIEDLYGVRRCVVGARLAGYVHLSGDTSWMWEYKALSTSCAGGEWYRFSERRAIICNARVERATVAA